MERIDRSVGDRRSEGLSSAPPAHTMTDSNDYVAPKAIALTFDNREATAPIDLDALKALRALLAPLRVKDATALIREMRDESDH